MTVKQAWLFGALFAWSSLSTSLVRAQAPATSASSAPAASASAAAPAPPATPAHGAQPPGPDPSQDAVENSALVPANTITAIIVDDQNQPLRHTRVRLGVMFQKISEGESRSEKFADTDENGKATFSGLTHGSDHAYRVTVQSGPANYQSSPFNLVTDMGVRVVLHVFPASSDIEQVQFGMRGYLYVETRDDVFQCEVLFRVFNVGQVTWVPKDIVVPLPSGFKAFKAQEGMTDVGFEQVDGVGARLKGTFPPGQSEASFRFQIPKSRQESLTFHMGLPPHVAEMRVIAEASSNMNLEVPGFQPPVPTANQNGQRVLVSVRQLTRRDEEMKDFTATLSGIPTPGPGRWFAVMVALGIAISGVLAANGAFDDAGGVAGVTQDKKRARELLLRELLALENARREERIGPKAYEQTRGALIDAIARLGLPEERAKKRREGKLGSRKRASSAAERG